MTYLTLDEIHAALLGILSEFDRVCRKYGLHYTLAYGTLIGAIRHKGFIPRDDRFLSADGIFCNDIHAVSVRYDFSDRWRAYAHRLFPCSFSRIRPFLRGGYRDAARRSAERRAAL